VSAATAAAPRRHLVSYAAGPAVYRTNQQRLVRSARQFGFESIHAFGEDALDGEFRRAHAEVLAAAEGAGYWLWKPYLVLEVLKASAPDDVIVYVDAGAFLRNSPDALWREAPSAELILFENDYPKRRVHQTRCVRSHRHRCARASLGPAARRQLPDRTETARRPGASSRSGSSSAATRGSWPTGPAGREGPELPGFVAHRHDQSALSLLLRLYGDRRRPRAAPALAEAPLPRSSPAPQRGGSDLAVARVPRRRPRVLAATAAALRTP
jgi:hypothetical protein